MNLTLDYVFDFVHVKCVWVLPVEEKNRTTKQIGNNLSKSWHRWHLKLPSGFFSCKSTSGYKFNIAITHWVPELLYSMLSNDLSAVSEGLFAWTHFVCFLLVWTILVFIDANQCKNLSRNSRLHHLSGWLHVSLSAVCKTSKQRKKNTHHKSGPDWQS